MTDLRPALLTSAFRAMSARLGSDPLQVQGPGGNTSIKDDTVMWIKASGTELANAETDDIFVAVDRRAAQAEAGGAGDGSCKETVLDPSRGLRPSIETTFHAALNHAVVAHTHSVATLIHVISPEGRTAVAEKLNGMPFVMVPYAKPGLPLTREILARVSTKTQVILLENHGLICCGASVEQVSELIAEVEDRLHMSAKTPERTPPKTAAPDGFSWSPHSWLAQDDFAAKSVKAGSYYPDHVVFLGPALATSDGVDAPPAIMIEGTGVAIRDGATASQHAMLTCLSDIFERIPNGWSLDPIGAPAEAELLNWDAEKYRQALAART